MEEVEPPIMEDFVYICDNTYTHDEIRTMEFQLLKTLKFDLSFASPAGFCAKFSCLANADRRASFLAQYLVDLTMQDYVFLKYIPSEIAASCVVLALHTLDLPHWNAALAAQTGYQLDFLLKDCVPALHLMFRKVPEGALQALRSRYSAPALLAVATAVPKATLPPHV